ncbi:MAG: hypothetical protein CL912_21105 [Deltaproteobacteria bacterium]|nr:hypothetical protein [Deltaproteobacteria bacterium]
MIVQSFKSSSHLVNENTFTYPSALCRIELAFWHLFSYYAFLLNTSIAMTIPNPLKWVILANIQLPGWVIFQSPPLITKCQKLKADDVNLGFNSHSYRI